MSADHDLPRVLDRTIAAAYCSLTPSGFSSWVREGRLPGPLPGTKRLDRRALDAALDRISRLCGTAGDGGSVGDGASPLDAWRAKRRVS